MSQAEQEIFGTVVRELIGAHAEGIDSGAAAVKKRIMPAILALEEQFKAASEDPQARLPTALSVAIDNIIRLVKSDAVNDYANEMAKRDQIVRHDGRVEHDVDPAARARLEGGL